MIVDEASLAGTLALDELVGAARGAGAKVLLVGDWAQLGAVEAGGAFGLLARDRGDRVPELSDVRRFLAPWETAPASQLRLGEASCLEDYAGHGGSPAGRARRCSTASTPAWKSDVAAGKSSLMIAGDAATVAELNRRARAERVARGQRRRRRSPRSPTASWRASATRS